MKKPNRDKDQRRHVRRDIGRGAAVVLPDGSTVGCAVRDISETGAMLFLKTSVELPSLFVLEIPGNETVRRRCERVRQDGTTVGVRFPERPLNRP